MINALDSMNICQVLLLTLVLFLTMISNVESSSQRCIPSSCGDVRNISFPFRLKSHQRGCGISKFELACEDNRTILNFLNGQYYVQFINYTGQQIRLVDNGLQRDNCLSLPHHSLSLYDFHRVSTLDNPYSSLSYKNISVIVNCSKPRLYVSYCGGGQFCASTYYYGGVLDDIAFWTTWDLLVLLIVFCVVKFIIGMPFVAIFLIYKYRRRHIAMDKNIEEFLQAHNNFLPIRYSYSNIKKITRNFKHKLGEGGYGHVYKGTLRSGNEVAIKILKQSKAHGQDFISEVATVGRIHHVNIVQLIGFCFEGSKQALVYDFMSNGSLDKRIFTKEGDKFLDYKKIYEIALGVVRGIEYLHRGCDKQILHFDIKPHNILLDKNFLPKISDFGLAKLYPIDHSIVSMTAARGTLGYMAPELFYKTLGGVSYKADVYSFGMLLMEMAGRRKNLNANAEHSSQIYFPLWVYDHINEGESVEMDEIVGEEREVMKKMIIVALWCIQLVPDHRPPMNKVLKMLERDIGNIQMPPKPLIYPPNERIGNDIVEMELETFSTSSSTPIISPSFPFGDSTGV
ncbi:rust resistance kinase Lr10 isoform X4 [Eucalyptus grandis]|uniref:rust resistance kinase Lr10 isoform X4 n=1 Tax=Eucalyptus grandis TaxID=71139 RepID=UPI00192F005E|nr:rust resistance kinase Lr10 isoform X4 [Eucalyptus grandis]